MANGTDTIIGKTTPTMDGEWTRGVKYIHPSFIMHEDVMYLSTADNINEEPGVSNKWSYFIKEGGGGSAAGVKFSVINSSGWNSKSVTPDSNVNVCITWSSTEDDVPTGNGTFTISVNGITKSKTEVPQGEVTANIKNYLSLGENSVKLNITDSYGSSRSIVLTVEVAALTIESTFDASVLQEGDIIYRYTPYGNADKVVHFIVDDIEVATVNTSASNRQLSQTISALPFGSHSLKVYFTTILEGEEVSSNILQYSVISVYEPQEDADPIISVNYDKNEVTQYETIEISYQVYDPANLTAEVDIDVNGEIVSELTVDRTVQIFNYKAYTVGNVSITFICGEITKTIVFRVVDSGINISAETEGLQLYLTSEGRSNTETNRSVWKDRNNDITATLSGFNWASNGWIKDKDGITALHINNGATVDIPYQIFANDFRANGKTIEFEFSSVDVLNYDTVIATCMSDGKGIEITPQYVSLHSEGSHITTQYKEDEHVRISFVIEREAQGTRLIHCYINGIDSGVVQYPVGDNFQQVTPVNFVIGSNQCGVDIYNIRIYDAALSSYQIVENWIADTQDVDLMLERYARNNIYDEYGEISIRKLPVDVPYMVLQVSDYSDLPQYKGDKKNIKGYFIDPENSANNFTFENVQFNVQGTSSQYYARKNYKASWKKGTVTMEDGTVVKALPINGGLAGAVWCLKADVASSEGANNTELVRIYNDLCPYKTPYQKANPKVRQGIDGFPMLVFWEDDNGKQHFLGKYNGNYDKDSENVFGFREGDECWESKNNTSGHTRWKDDDFESTKVDKDGNTVYVWLDDFEARYPEGNEDSTNLKALETWMKSTSLTTKDAQGNTVNMWTNDPITPVTYEGVEYTNDTKEYRLAKFKAEVGNWWELEDILFKYVFCETFLMIDNWAKNSFASKMGGSKWIDLPYDFDTGLGINNEGALVFSPFLEDIDQFDNADVYNGQDSTLWRNLRDTYYPRISAMYNDLRATGKFSYDAVSKRFTDHQSKWSENIFNEDALFKYIQPLIDDGNTAYLDMLQGSKAEQRKFWLYQRFKYLDSKYIAGDSASDVITLRGYAKTDIAVTPFQPIYVAIKYANSMVHKRGQANVETILPCPLELVNDTETYIYSASQIKAISDLTNYKVGYADFSKAVRLQNLVVHRGDEENTNNNLTNLALGNNKLLQTLVCTYAPNLKQNINLSGCTGLKSVDFTGTEISGVTLANGAAIESLILPNTITNLTLRNTTKLETLSIGDDTDYSNITTLWLENFDSILADKNKLFTILNDIPDKSRLRLIGLNLSFSNRSDIDTLYNIFDRLTGIDANGNNTDKAQVSGTITIDVISDDRVRMYKERYPYINIVGTYEGYPVKYMNGDVLLFTDNVGLHEDSDYMGDTPTKPTEYNGTNEIRYEFVGWASSDGQTAPTPDIQKDITPYKSNICYAAFQPTTYYYVYYKTYDGSELLYTDTVVSGGNSTYGGDEASKVPDSGSDIWGYVFVGWVDTANKYGDQSSTLLVNINATKTVYASVDTAIKQGYLPELLNPTPNGVASNSGGRALSNPANAFDHNDSTSTATNSAYGSSVYASLRYDFGGYYSIKMFNISGYAWGERTMRNVTIKASVDGSTWVTLNANDTVLPNASKKTFELEEATKGYRYLNFDFYATGGNSMQGGLGVHTIDIYGMYLKPI